MKFTYKFYDKAEDAQPTDQQEFIGTSEKDVRQAVTDYCDTYGYEAFTLVNTEETAGDAVTGDISKALMLEYLQQMLDDFMQEKEKYGIEDRIVEHKFDAMIACKEMVEALIQEPVNLRKDGRVTVGF